MNSTKKVDPDVVWNDIMDKHAAEGPLALTPTEQKIFHTNRFLIDFEMGGISGFLYNVSPDERNVEWTELRETVAAIRSFGQDATAALLEEARGIVEVPTGSGVQFEVWGGFLAAVDPDGRLDKIGDELEDACEPLWDDLTEAASNIETGDT